MKKCMIIVNPAAGGGLGRKSIPEIENLLKRHSISYQLVLSEYHGHTIKLAKEAALQDFYAVVAAGGDGTVNEVINGLMDAKAPEIHLPALGVLCVGRGNDFASGMDIPYDLESGCKALKLDQRRMIDIGRVYGGLYPQGRYFGNCVGVGFDAIGTIEVAKLPRLGGFLSYVIAIFKTIFLYFQAPVSTVCYDGQKLTQPSLLVSVMNGRRLGGGFKMAPNALPDDGYFDLCIAHQVSRLEMFRLISLFLRGTQTKHPAIKTGRVKNVSISCETGALPAQTDGEILCIDGKKIEVELLARQIEVIYHPQGNTA
jgi:diacylglycerol kinase (ATP)